MKIRQFQRNSDNLEITFLKKILTSVWWNKDLRMWNHTKLVWDGKKKSKVPTVGSCETLLQTVMFLWWWVNFSKRGVKSVCFCRYVRVAVLPCKETTRCLFRTRGSLPQDVVEFNEVFGMQISHSALRQKTLRVDVCNTRKSGHEDCLVRGNQIKNISLFKSCDIKSLWFSWSHFFFSSSGRSSDQSGRRQLLRGEMHQVVQPAESSLHARNLQQGQREQSSRRRWQGKEKETRLWQKTDASLKRQDSHFSAEKKWRNRSNGDAGVKFEKNRLSKFPVNIHGVPTHP